MNNTLKVSIIVPIYNIAEYLHQCLESIISQTFQNLEIILVNDGSTDHSEDICQYFAEMDSRIILLEQVNMGLVNARKSGLRAATGDYILNIDGDDWITSDCVTQLVTNAVSVDADIVIAGYYREFNGTLKSELPNIPVGLYDKCRIEKYIFPRMIVDSNNLSHGVSTYSWGKLFRKSLYEPIQEAVPESITVGEDALVTYPSICAAQRIVITDCEVYYYRQRLSSMLKKVSEDKYYEISRINYLTGVLRDQLYTYAGYDFNSQITCYQIMISAERTGMSLCQHEIESRLLNTDRFNKTDAIALYSTGTFGQKVYAQLNKSGYKISAWLDEDYSESMQCELSVTPLHSIQTPNIDIFFIATWNIDNRKRIIRLIECLYGDELVFVYPLIKPESYACLLKTLTECENA